MKQIVKFLNTFVFFIATAVLLGVYYEGIAREWFPIVGIFILMAVVMKVRGLSYPVWSLAAWNFYIWFVYGYLVIKGCWRPKRKRIFAK